jgi:hypothetical protein
MVDYISREAALEAAKKSRLYFDIKPIINSIPAADARPVVLCRDCKHRFITPNGWHCPYAEWGIEDDDFCSCGEKREES